MSTFCLITYTQPFNGSVDFVRDNTGEPIPEGTFRHLLDILEQNEDTQADVPTIWMDCHTIQTNWCRQLCHPHHFYAGCPSLHNPLNLSWLGTGTKYAGLHTQWLLIINRYLTRITTTTYYQAIRVTTFHFPKHEIPRFFHQGRQRFIDILFNAMVESHCFTLIKSRPGSSVLSGFNT